MNVLIYVITFLMLLSILTYASLDSFRNFVGLQAGFIHYMQATERKTVNETMKKVQYDGSIIKSTPPSKTEKEDEAKSTPKSKATSRLSLYILLNPEERAKNDEAYKETRALLKQLITDLYSKEQFFQDISKTHPNFIEEIFNAIQEASDQLPPDQKITETLDLSKLKLNPPELHYVFYLMLNGLPKLEVPPKDPSEKSKKECPPDENDEIDAELESQEVHAKAGYTSLLDSITVRNTSNKTRVFLASKALLTSIYKDPHIVDNILTERKDLFKQVRAKKLTPIEASRLFEGHLKGQSTNYEQLLDFSVTKTNPKEYE